VLNFVTVDKRVRFEISLIAAERAGLRISSELLSVAIRVHGGRRQSDFLCLPLSPGEESDSPCAPRLARRIQPAPAEFASGDVVELRDVIIGIAT
jgi:hypothetical protein